MYDYIWPSFFQGLFPLIVVSVCICAISALMLVAVNRNKAFGDYVLLFSFVLLGVVLGFSTGNSREPAVVALMNGLLTVVTLLLANVYGKDHDRAIMKKVPVMLISLIMASIMGLIMGSMNRSANDTYEKPQTTLQDNSPAP